MFGGNFAPRGWALCDGQLLDISSHTALFSILGTTYGGDGRTNFRLPELRGRVALHAGNGPGLTNRPLGHRSGLENVALSVNEIPTHNHPLTDFTLPISTATANHDDPDGAVFGAGPEIYSQAAPDATMPITEGTVGNTGNGVAHTNMQPYNTVNYIIALVGTFPSRN